MTILRIKWLNTQEINWKHPVHVSNNLFWFWEFHIPLMVFPFRIRIHFFSTIWNLFSLCAEYICLPRIHFLVYQKLSHDMVMFVAPIFPSSLSLIKISSRVVVILLLSMSSKMQNCQHARSTNLSFPIPDFLLTYMHFLFREHLFKFFCHSPVPIKQQVEITWNHPEWLSKEYS